MIIVKIRDPYQRENFDLPIEKDIAPEQLREITDFLDSDTRRVWADDGTKRRYVPYSTNALIYEGMDYAAPDTPESILLREEEDDGADEEEKLEMYLSCLTETQRRRVRMRLKGMSFKDIAEIEGADSSSVRESVRAVWQKLHKKFPEKFPKIPPLK